MKQVSKLIYREITNLIPDIAKLKPLTKTDLKAYGFANIYVFILESKQEEINFILTHYTATRGVLIPNPTTEIVIYPYQNRAEVVTYRDPYFSYQIFPDTGYLDINANYQANKLVYEWLKDLKVWKQRQESNLSTFLLQ